MALVKALALILNRFKRFEEEMGKEDAEPQEVQLSWAELSWAEPLGCRVGVFTFSLVGLQISAIQTRLTAHTKSALYKAPKPELIWRWPTVPIECYQGPNCVQSHCLRQPIMDLHFQVLAIRTQVMESLPVKASESLRPLWKCSLTLQNVNEYDERVSDIFWPHLTSHLCTLLALMCGLGTWPVSMLRWMRRSHPCDFSPGPEWRGSGDGSLLSTALPDAVFTVTSNSYHWSRNEKWSGHKGPRRLQGQTASGLLLRLKRPNVSKCAVRISNTSSLSGLASSYWSKEMWDFASKYLPLGSWWNHFKLLYFWIQAIGI